LGTGGGKQGGVSLSTVATSILTRESVDEVLREMEGVYRADDRPWIVGYSGGKDSTCVVQMVFRMLEGIKKKERCKLVHIVSSNTQVESPLISIRIEKTLAAMSRTAKKLGLPIETRYVRPVLDETFWVNLIGRGYPSPNRWFRWCTDRLKIKPISRYIRKQVKDNGEVVILLGARKSESASRSQTMDKYEIPDFRLRRHSSISGAFVYTPIEDFNARDVWTYLLQVPSPWGDKNRDLIAFYRQVDGECPMQLDAKTSSCGGSRFGCWVCTVVDRDRSAEGLIEEGKTWLEPLLDFRNWLKKIRDDPKKRESVRKSERRKKDLARKLGRRFEPKKHRGFKVLGPFTFETRREILKRLLEVQDQHRDQKTILISPEELRAIDLIWRYENGTGIGTSLSGGELTSVTNELSASPCLSLDSDSSVYLHEISNSHDIPIHLLDNLMAAEEDFSNVSRKRDVYSRLERVVEEHVYSRVYPDGRKNDTE
jgi:DNA sulfur modification protein DndC